MDDMTIKYKLAKFLGNQQLSVTFLKEMVPSKKRDNLCWEQVFDYIIS